MVFQYQVTRILLVLQNKMASVVFKNEASGFVNNWQSGKTLAECNLHMLTSEDSCDVSFLVGQTEKTVRAHRYVLISRSCVFHAMLIGPLAEKDDIKIPDVEEDLFVEMLKYLYTNTSKLAPDNVTGLLYLSKKYAVGGLERLCVSYLNASLSPDNACVILEQAHSFDEKDLQEKALKVILQNGDISLMSVGFNDLCHECLDKVVKAEDLEAKAETVFKTVLTWTKAECERQGEDVTPENERHVLGDTVYQIPFAEMGGEIFAKIVVPSRLLSGDECTQLFCFFNLPDISVSPFKAKLDDQSYNSNIKNCQRVALYKERCLLPSEQYASQLYSSIKLKTSRDVMVLGFNTNGDRGCSEYIYEVAIGRGGMFAYVEELGCTHITGKLLLSGTDEVEVKLAQPVLLKGSLEYSMGIRTKRGRSRHYGNTLRSTVFLNECSIDVRCAVDDERKMGVISSLILRNM